MGCCLTRFRWQSGAWFEKKTVAALADATDVVISHFHGDHVPLTDANPYQLAAQRVLPLLRTPRLWCKGPDDLSFHMRQRYDKLTAFFGRSFPNAEGKNVGQLSFSLPVPHGEVGSGLGTVMMTRITEDGGVFVHASDIQLMSEEAADQILAWHPDVVLAAGPPIYRHSTAKQQKLAWNNGVRLARAVTTLILDHHLMRSVEGVRFLRELSAKTGHKVVCAADFMGRRRMLLEAWRRRLYREMPVPSGWHEAYARGEVDTRGYRDWHGWHVDGP
jgi:predicted metallo-beta-lactamase superfamily hydrolase